MKDYDLPLQESHSLRLDYTNPRCCNKRKRDVNVIVDQNCFRWEVTKVNRRAMGHVDRFNRYEEEFHNSTNIISRAQRAIGVSDTITGN